MKKIILIILAVYTLITNIGAQSKSLYECQKEAIANYPMLKDKDVMISTSQLQIESIKTSYLPQLMFSGQATWQSDAININMPLPNNPINIKQSKDQYKLQVEAYQSIYDGGLVRSQKKLEETNLQVELQQLEVELYKVKELTNNAFFTILILQENIKLLNTTINELKERENSIAASIKNGILNQSDLDNLKATRIGIEQQWNDAVINKLTAIGIVSFLIGQKLDENTIFTLPETTLIDTSTKNRPEFKYFELQIKKLDDSKNVTASIVKPKINAFAQFGYGRPGLNMLSDDFNPFFITGAAIKWNIYDWNKNNKEKQIIDIQKQRIESKKNNFDRSLDIERLNKKSTIDKLRTAIARDSTIVQLRQNILQTANSRLANGIITSTEYIADLNALTIAKINFETHKIQLVQAIENYKFVTGN